MKGAAPGCVMAATRYVRVEHVNINEGAQAVIGNVRTQGGRRAKLAVNQLGANDPDPRNI
jgi:hypothetical protein